MRLRPAALAVAFALAALPARACMWDYDTIAEEHDRVPTAMETISGTFNRHSPAFYEWRIQDRRKKLEKDPNNVALLDDLGVALCKTGRFKEALEVGEREVALDPKRYESQSNLGTYYIFAGDLEKSAEHIKAALAINPDAHFGREKYQLYLVEYLLEAGKRKNPMRWPLQENFDEVEREISAPTRANFSDFLAAKIHPDAERTPLDDADLEKAITGVLGMMRFARHDLPLLNEALGDLLLELHTHPHKGHDHTQQIAARAYLQASYHAPVPEAAEAYRQLASSSLEMQSGVPLAALEADFKKELAQGDLWMVQIAGDEQQWITSSPDPDAAFNAKYRADPQLKIDRPWMRWHDPETKTKFRLAIAAAIVVLATTAIAFFLRRKKRQSPAKTPPPAR